MRRHRRTAPLRRRVAAALRHAAPAVPPGLPSPRRPQPEARCAGRYVRLPRVMLRPIPPSVSLRATLVGKMEHCGVALAQVKALSGRVHGSCAASTTRIAIGKQQRRKLGRTELDRQRIAQPYHARGLEPPQPLRPRDGSDARASQMIAADPVSCSRSPVVKSGTAKAARGYAIKLPSVLK